MPIRHTIWAGLLFAAAAGWAAQTSFDMSSVGGGLHHARVLLIPAGCVGLGVVVWLNGRWIREPRRFTPAELAPYWEN